MLLTTFCSYIPEDTQVTPWAYAVHRDPSNFSPIPEMFWPDRWLPSSRSHTHTDPPPSGDAVPATSVRGAAFVPFSLGPQSCVGRALALAEVRAAAAGERGVEGVKEGDGDGEGGARGDASAWFKYTL